MLDLDIRQAGGFSGVLDAAQGGRWARFVWARGQCLGGFTVGGCLPLVSAVVWTSRAARANTLGGHWPELERQLRREQFYGLLVSGARRSVWDTGQMLTGRLPQAGERYVAYSPNTPENRERLLHFWRDLLGAVHHNVPLDAYWKQVCMRLSAEHPCLDPFLREVTLSGGVLSVDAGVGVGEFRPALHSALRMALVGLGISLNDLALGDLPNRPEWAAATLPRRQVGW